MQKKEQFNQGQLWKTRNLMTSFLVVFSFFKGEKGEEEGERKYEHYKAT